MTIMKRGVKARLLNMMFVMLLVVAMFGAYVLLGSASVYATEEGEGSDPLSAAATAEDEEAAAGTTEGFPDGIQPVTIVPPASEIVDIEVPLAVAPAPEPAPVVVIPSERPPLASFATWAVLNLIFVIATAAITALLLVAWFRNRTEVTGLQKLLYPASIAPTVVAVIIFAMTQNMSLPPALADRWTGGHIIILVAAVALAIVITSRKETLAEEA